VPAQRWGLTKHTPMSQLKKVKRKESSKKKVATPSAGKRGSKKEEGPKEKRKTLEPGPSCTAVPIKKIEKKVSERGRVLDPGCKQYANKGKIKKKNKTVLYDFYSRGVCRKGSNDEVGEESGILYKSKRRGTMKRDGERLLPTVSKSHRWNLPQSCKTEKETDQKTTGDKQRRMMNTIRNHRNQQIGRPVQSGKSGRK